MALKLFPLPVSFPIFVSPPSGQPPPDRHCTDVRFSRWNNENAREFEDRRRAQQEIEADIRRHRRFHSATNIINTATTDNTTNNNSIAKSIGTPSSPSLPSIPGKKSKYSKPDKPNRQHPAFRHASKITKLPLPGKEPEPVPSRKAKVRVGDDGVSFVIDGAPFEFKYSYTETPKTQPVKLRETPFSPFGPNTMARPWTGRAPLPPSKKKLKEFDSFQLPPPHKKGVKPVQAPGPYLPGTGPRYVRTREEILGEPLSKEEVEGLVNGCLKSKRQLNMGRDGLTHNMLDNIHALWKRRRVCKIKCKGVCTVDMDNVCQQLEERTGGKIIYQRGGVLYLFRGRNYNFKLRPRFPLMLWKPITPVYPRLIQRAPAGLTLEEASEMRKKGRTLIPICKLAKNGVYSHLVKDVREAFEVCELARINCQGINGSDYRKIGAKLRDLVPCVLISFEHEHILMWRGKEWKSSLVYSVLDSDEAEGSNINISTSSENQNIEVLASENLMPGSPTVIASPVDSGKQVDGLSASEVDDSFTVMDNSLSTVENHLHESMLDNAASPDRNVSEDMGTIDSNEAAADCSGHPIESTTTTSTSNSQVVSECLHGSVKQATVNMTYAGEVLRLLKEAIDTGNATVLANTDLDADTVYQRAVALAQSAPPGPVFTHKPRRTKVQKPENEENDKLEFLDGKELTSVAKKDGNVKKSSRSGRRKEFNDNFLDVAPRGSLKVDELAKLLA